jgi:hypothetical protein
LICGSGIILPTATKTLGENYKLKTHCRSKMIRRNYPSKKVLKENARRKIGLYVTSSFKNIGAYGVQAGASISPHSLVEPADEAF